MGVRKAKSIEVLFDEFNTRFPGRSRLSDGWLGDAAHQSRTSDHNAWIEDGPDRIVSAGDITEDAEGGFKEIIDWAFRVIVGRRDPRVKYLIHEDRILRSYEKPGIPAWTWDEYDGPNGHFKHGHVSVLPEKRFYDSTAPWGLLKAPDAPKPKNPTQLAHELAGQALAKLYAANMTIREHVSEDREAVHAMEHEWTRGWHIVSVAKKKGPQK